MRLARGPRGGLGRRPRARGAALAAGAALLLLGAGAGCLKVAPFACTDSTACVHGGEAGTCEASGWCSFPDLGCDTGRRYGDGAGAGLAGTCVAGTPPQDAGGDAAGDAGPDATADAGGDAAAPADAQTDVAACAEGALSCDGDNVMRCWLGTLIVAQTCALGCLPQGSDARCYAFAPHNVPEATLTAGTYDWVIGVDTDVTTNGGNLPAGVGRTTAQQADGARELVILTVRSLWVQPGVILRISGNSAVAIVASDHLLVEGVIDVSASGPTAGPGGWRGGNGGSAGQAPTGATPPAAGATGGTSGEDTGGSGGCFGGVGGRGGAVAAADAPAAGTAFGATSLVPLFGGGGGGGGGGLGSGGDGGGGGGALQLVAAVRIDVSGIVIAAGFGGGGGENGFTYGAAGGGGAGGGILVEAPAVVVAGVLAANGGGGGGGAYQGQKVGSPGVTGQPSGTPAAGGDGGNSTDPTIGAGGAGAAGTTAAAPGRGGAGSTPNGGGGGGGAGRIAVYTRTGGAPGGTCSPAAVPFTITPK